MFSSPLRRAISSGLKPGGDLVAALQDLDDYPIRTKKDAKAICDALSTLPSEQDHKNHISSPLHALTSLFQDVEGRDTPAYHVLYQEGIPQLIRIFQATLERGDEDDESDLLFVLKVLALYGSREGAEMIVEAARRPLGPEAYLWHVILAVFSERHPQREFVYRALSAPLPSGFIAIGLLDSANGVAIEGHLDQHPFDSQAGTQLLQQWLEDSNPEKTSYAHSATAALPFVSNPARDQLLALAMDHVDASVQMEAAWAAGKLGREAGLNVLARFCVDVNHSDVAKRYLAELDREDLIPVEATDESFEAKATFARWLSHPNELGRAPDELEIVDHRQLAWPPERTSQPFWLIQYRLRDETGLEGDDVDRGLVGSATWCFFSYKMHQRPPEDAYAIHCYWEMEHANLIVENEVTDASEYAGLLGQWKGGQIESARITRVAEVSPKLQIDARLVALASGEQNGQEGWVILDGPRSAWYPKSEQPDETFESVILMIHVGRQLLGFGDEPDRKKYLLNAEPGPNPREFAAAYERLLDETPHASPERLEELLGNHGLFARHFDTYVDAVSESNGDDKVDIILRVYERFLQFADASDESFKSDAYDSFSVLGKSFGAYVDALLARERQEEVAKLIDTFAPHWEHNLGYGELGSAAFKAGQIEVAEKYILTLRDGLESSYRCEEMSMLAQIWNDRGEGKAAKELLIECMKKIVVDIRESEYNSDREMFADEFRHHRQTYLSLFPQSENELESLGIPVDPLD